ncbi:MAG: tetratricopeptide repeat protein [Gemmatimonadetes bacterium]|nr:tetratricopeptide repeat protein [Gemmatimonadota bacterium]
MRTGAFASIAALLATLGWGAIRRRRRYEFLPVAPHRPWWAPAAIGAAALLVGLSWSIDVGSVRAEDPGAAFRAAARRSWEVEATAAWQAGAVPAVIELLERSLRLAPEDANSWSRLGLAYRAAGRESEAELAFRKALAIDPEEPRAKRALGAGNLQGDRDNATAP